MSTRRAFTLIELLVTLSIMGLLAAILLPSLRGARIQAKRTVCAARLTQVGLALQMYLPDNNDRLPYASFMPSMSPFPLRTEDPIFIADVLEPQTGGDPVIFQ